jgi:hypothetical protein
VTAQGSLAEGFEDRYRTRNSRMGLPNFGAMMAYDTRNKRGLKRVTFGIVGNVTRDYTNKLRASGTNASTTVAGSLASQADGYSVDVLDNASYYGSGIPSWETMVGWQSGIVEQINGSYVGLTESLLDNGKIVLTELMRMATSLGLDTVTEGVETTEQVRFLQEICCSKMQGFHYSPPEPIEKVLERHRLQDLIESENPAESDYYKSVGRLNLFDMGAIAAADEGSWKNAFVTAGTPNIAALLVKASIAATAQSTESSLQTSSITYATRENAPIFAALSTE